MAQDGQVLVCVSLAYPTVVFSKSDIQYPVQAVFNAPMRPLAGCQDLTGVIGQAGDEIARFDTGFSLQAPLGTNHDNGL